ncbi:hypothetical protein Avbf_17725 [Armadillidium vulgare]|nr:hypothetical protein Avbf_17725 [Armadillidium vulgare]
MSDSDENISDSSDSDSCDEWQDYFSDPEDTVLDDNALPPVIINTISKTCPQDGRKFSSILKFVMREGNVMFLHENGAKISCGRPDMLQSHQRPQSPQNPNNIDIPLYVPNRRNMDVFSPPEPIWRWRRQKYVPSPAGRWNQEQRLKCSSTSLNPGSRRKTTPPGIEKQNPQWQWCKRNQWIKFGWMRFGGICFCEMCLSSSQGLPSSSDLEMMERRTSSIVLFKTLRLKRRKSLG